MFSTAFAEHNMLRVFHQLLDHSSLRQQPSLAVSTLNLLSILLHSIQSDEFRYYLLSHESFNRIIVDFSAVSNDCDDFSLQEDLIPTYISYLKTIALILNPTNVILLIDASKHSLPIYSKSLELLHRDDLSPDHMIKSNLQTIILHILSLDEANCRSICLLDSNVYELSSICIQHLNLTFAQLNHLWRTLSEPDDIEQDVHLEFSSLLRSFEDNLFFIQDVYDIGLEALQIQVLHGFLIDFMYVNVLDPILRGNDPHSIHLSLMLISCILQSLPHHYVLSVIVNSLLHPSSRSHRKQVLVSYSNVFRTPFDSSPEPNPYRVQFMEIRRGSKSEELSAQSSLVLFNLYSAFAMSTESALRDNDLTVVGGLIMQLSATQLLPSADFHLEDSSSQQVSSFDCLHCMMGEPDLLQLNMLPLIAHLQRQTAKTPQPTPEADLFSSMVEMVARPSQCSLLSAQLSTLSLSMVLEAIDDITASHDKNGNEDRDENSTLFRYLMNLRESVASLFTTSLQRLKSNLSTSLSEETVKFIGLSAKEYRFFTETGGVDGLINTFKLISTTTEPLMHTSAPESKEQETLNDIKLFLLLDDISSRFSLISADGGAAKLFGTLFAHPNVERRAIDIRDKMVCAVSFDEAEEEIYLLVLEPFQLTLATLQLLEDEDNGEGSRDDAAHLRNVLFSTSLALSDFSPDKDFGASVEFHCVTETDILFFQAVLETGDVVDRGHAKSVILEVNFEDGEMRDLALQFLLDQKSSIYEMLCRVFD